MILQAHGSTLPDLFENTAHNLFDFLLDTSEVGEALREKIMVEAPDTKQVLQAWVEALVGLARDQKMVFTRFSIRLLQKAEGGVVGIQAEVLGELFDVLRHAWRHSPDTLHCREVYLDQSDFAYQAKIFLESH